MNENLALFLMYIVAPVIVAMGSYLMSTFLNRISTLEKTMVNKVEEPEVRQILADKIDPLREDISELKNKIELIYSLLLKR